MKVGIIGAGPAGYVAALTAARFGAEVFLFERQDIGGTCLNRGCVPTKTLISSLELYEKIQKATDFGLKVENPSPVTLKNLMERKDKVVEIQKRGLQSLLKQAKVKLIHDDVELISPKRLFLNRAKQQIDFEKVIIATGSRPAELPHLKFDGKYILSSDDLWQLQEIPESVVIIGGGAIGCEFAWIFHLIGSKVSLLEIMPRILPMEDEEISEAIQRIFKKRKIEVFTGLKIEDLTYGDEGLIRLTLSNGKVLTAQYVLVSVGRAFNTEAVKTSGVLLGRKGEVLVDETMKTNIEDVYAVGDVNGRWLLAHVAYKEAEVAVKNIFGHFEKMDYSFVPSTIFTATEVASIGLKEKEAIEKGIKLKKGFFPFRANAKAHVMGEIDGFVKVLLDEDSETLIGAHIVGPKASELIHELSVAIKLKLKAKDIKDLIYSHPTLSECIGEAVKDIFNEAVHKL